MKDQLQTLRTSWAKLSKIPGGKRAFSKLVGRIAPYTGTINAQVIDLRRGYARVTMKDAKRVRNHLDCVHAIALMNLAEICSGLAFVFSTPPGSRTILTNLTIDYEKKARGLLTAECHCVAPSSNDRNEYEVEVITRDTSGAVVTVAVARWLVSPL